MQGFDIYDSRTLLPLALKFGKLLKVSFILHADKVRVRQPEVRLLSVTHMKSANEKRDGKVQTPIGSLHNPYLLQLQILSD